MASSPRLAGVLVGEAEYVAKYKAGDVTGGAAFIRGVLTGLEIALRVTHKHGGKLKDGEVARVLELKEKFKAS